ncbi:SDR family NAD(P)-dependent oxidoreductase [Streptomyces albus]
MLTSRRGPDAPGAGELREELTALGAKVTIAACDVSDRAALAALLAALRDDGRRLRTVVHAAGVVQATPLGDMSLAECAGVIAAKVRGAAHLDELVDEFFDEADLDAFVLFSSNAGVWGSGGQAAYAAANAALDALAQSRRERGRTATSVAWGAWGGSGMAADPAGGGAAASARRDHHAAGAGPRRTRPGPGARRDGPHRRGRRLGALRDRLHRGPPPPTARRVARRPAGPRRHRAPRGGAGRHGTR